MCFVLFPLVRQARMSRLLPARSTVGMAALISYVAFSKSTSLPLAIFRKLVALLLVLNWRALPGVWHAELWSFVPLLHAKIRLQGLEKTMSIGRSPFSKITSRKRVTFDAGDWLGHLSNSSYVLPRFRRDGDFGNRHFRVLSIGFAALDTEEHSIRHDSTGCSTSVDRHWVRRRSGHPSPLLHSLSYVASSLLRVSSF